MTRKRTTRKRTTRRRTTKRTIRKRRKQNLNLIGAKINRTKKQKKPESKIKLLNF